MKCICKETYKIDGVVVAKTGDVLKIVDAVPGDGESYEDVDGYCDIVNKTTGETFNVTWIDVDLTILELTV